jgi:hypothetical protein
MMEDHLLSVVRDCLFKILQLEDERKVYKILVGKPEGKRPIARPRRRWENGSGMDLRKIGLGCVDWIRLAQDRHRWQDFVKTVMNIRVLTPRS